MPFLRAFSFDLDSNLDDYTPPTNLLMRNTFLVFRLVLLALMSNFALLSLIFASWNASATISLGMSASSTSIFVMFESCLVFFCLVLAFADFFRPKARMSRTLLECSWVGALSVFQMGGAISTVINGPASACHATSDWNVCASTSLLVPTTWLSGLIFLTYFLALFVATMAHKSIYPDIWRRPIYSIQWFEQAQEPPSKEKVVQDFCHGKPRDEQDPYAAYYEDIESTAMRKKHYPIRDSVEEAVPWAAAQFRRGIDPPFSRPPGQASNRSSPTSSRNLMLPSYPDRSASPISAAGSRYLEKFRESSLLSRSEGPAQYTTLYHAHKNSFPLSVIDLDQPIPLPRLSEWVRADAMNGHNVHTKPPHYSGAL